jgi:hypothetical protein
VAELTTDLIKRLDRFIALARDVLERYAGLSELASAIFKQQQAADAINREFNEEVSHQLEDIERLFLLERTGNENSREAKRIKGKIQNRHDDKQLKELLVEQTKNRDAVLLKIAQHGGRMDAPIRYTRQLEELEASIEHIQEELDDID